MSNEFASSLREGTKQSHTLSENTAYMKCFLKGIVEKEPFRKLLANLYFVYTTLEEELQRHSDHPVISLIYFPELNRQESLAEDLIYFYGENWVNLITPLDGGMKYVNRIKEIAQTNPALLVAHAYVRYMGDLSGGQSLKNIAISALDISKDRGIKFYEFEAFPTIQDKRNFKEIYRDRLNSLPLNQNLIDGIIAEANNAFKLNRDVFHELENDVKNAIGDHVFDLITRQDKPGSTESRVNDQLAGVS
jgi:heme oxygenase (biliverdin-producing, ferredoxin)